MHPPTPQYVEGSLRASPSRRTARSVPGGKELAGAGVLPVSEVVSQPRVRDTGKAGARQAAGSGRHAIYRGTSPFPTRQLSPAGHVRGSENGSFNVIKYKRGVIQGGGGSL